MVPKSPPRSLKSTAREKELLKMFNPIIMIRRRRMKTLQQQPLFGYKSMTCHIRLPLSPQQYPRRSDFSKFAVLSIAVILCTFTSISESASASPTSNNNHNFRSINTQLLRNANVRGVRETGNTPLANAGGNNNYHFLEQQNEYDSSSSGVSILDDDTLKLSLAIDDDSAGGGLSAPSLHILEPKVYLRVSGESGMIKPDYQQQKADSNNEVVIRESSSVRFPSFRASSPTNSKNRGGQGTDLQFKSNEEDHEAVGGEEEDNDDDDDEDDMNDNYHHHFPYIESYREKYSKPDFGHYVPSVATTTPPPPTTQPTIIPTKEESSSSVTKSKQKEWSDIIAQVTTPSSFNEINSSASEHRLADFHFRANLPAYFYNKYSPYSEENLENVADLDGEHSKYFVKTRPRSVTTAGSNIYTNFYYEPPSFSTKSVPIPVKTNKENVIFASVKPTEDPQHLYSPSRAEDDNRQYNHSFGLYRNNNDDEVAQQDDPVMATISSNFTSHIPTLTPHQMNYDVEAEVVANHDNNDSDDNYSNESLLKPSASSAATDNRHPVQQQQQHEHYQNQQNHGVGSENEKKSSAETLDVSTSQSILSKVTLNNPHHPQLVIIKAEPIKTTSLTTPDHEIETSYDSNDRSNSKFDDGDSNASTEANAKQESVTPSTVTSTTDATSIPRIPGIDYPTLGEIPQTGFDCQKQRYKGFFADIDAKCQAWHYCDFTDGHSTFLCPNGTLFSQVLLTCDWWFNVDCNQARQLYVLNERLYRYIKPPKPSFPDDFIGEHVDKWLLQQFTDGFLPKVRKKSKAKLVNLPPPSTQASAESTPQKNDTDV